MVVLSRMCDSADEQGTYLQMPHPLGLVVGRIPFSNRPRQEAVFVLFIISISPFVHSHFKHEYL